MSDDGPIPRYVKCRYPSRKYHEKLLDAPIVIQEKGDGSQGAAMVVEDDDGNRDLYFRSKNTHRNMYDPDPMFGPAISHFKSVASDMEPGLVYYGEVVSSKKHNTLEYERTPDGHFILFDVYDPDTEEWGSEDEVWHWATELGVESPSTFHCGEFDGSLQDVVDHCEEEFLGRESFLGGPQIEGVVVKNRSIPGPYDPMIVAKIVDDDFKEKHQKNWDEKEDDKGTVVDNVIAEQNKERRWEKIHQHLQEDGELEGEMADLQHLIPALREDIEEELAGDVKERLWAAVKGDIFRALKSGMPEWWEGKLLEGGGGGDDE